jgi:uncharacterized protein YgbK (DUF1537 family)
MTTAAIDRRRIHIVPKLWDTLMNRIKVRVMPSVRILADDTTGALDCAAEFVGWCGPIPVGWPSGPADDLPPSYAADSGTREMPPAQAGETVRRLAALLAPADVAFKKVDSLFRGPWTAEIAACVAAKRWRHVILAPAFPHQGRRTQDGRQYARAIDGAWRPASEDLAELLRRAGVSAARADERDLAEGVSVFDAATDDDLDHIVARVRGVSDSVLWCGTAGLARALARGHEMRPLRTLKSPVIGLFGSDQPATLAQIEMCKRFAVAIRYDDDSGRIISQKLAETGVALATVALAAGTSREDAARIIQAAFDSVVARLPAPGTLIVAGGETLRGICGSLGVASLRVIGQAAPGIPRSVMQGGRWSGIDILSKSGAFGGREILRDLLTENGLLAETGPAS